MIRLYSFFSSIVKCFQTARIKANACFSVVLCFSFSVYFYTLLKFFILKKLKALKKYDINLKYITETTFIF